jgi:hypothetical protein
MGAGDGCGLGVTNSSVTPALPETASFFPGVEKPRTGVDAGTGTDAGAGPVLGDSDFSSAARISLVNSPVSDALEFPAPDAISVPMGNAELGSAPESFGSLMKIRVNSPVLESTDLESVGLESGGMGSAGMAAGDEVGEGAFAGASGVIA